MQAGGDEQGVYGRDALFLRQHAGDDGGQGEGQQESLKSVTGLEGAVAVDDLELLRQIDDHGEIGDTGGEGMKDHGSPEATGDEMPREDGFEFHFILALHSLSDEEGDPGEDGQKEENEGNRGCPGISSATFFQRGNQEDGGGEEYSSAGEIDLPDGSHAEFGVGMFRSAHERNIVRHEQEDESERDDPGWNAEINESVVYALSGQKIDLT